MTRVLVGVAALIALAAVAPGSAAAGVPVPWCGAAPSSVDRLPDATFGYAVHVVYARPPGAPDRFAEWAPRLAGDAAEIDAWWRGQDPTRALRFDLFPAPGCASSFGALDITSVALPQEISSIEGAFEELSDALGRLGFDESEKTYLVYYDGPTEQPTQGQVCGEGAGPFEGGSGLAVVYLDSCGASDGDVVRPITAVHELAHTLGAANRRSPNYCNRGHVCDSSTDLMFAVLQPGQLANRVLDVNRDDYYGHAGTWRDVQDSLFLERLDGPDRAPPTVPLALRVAEAGPGSIRLSWRAAQDDVGPVLYRIYENRRLVDETTSTFTILPGPISTLRYSVRAADPVGHLGPLATARFRPGAGMVDDSGRLVLDTVRPGPVAGVTVTRTKTTARLSWPVVRDAGGLRSYRVRIGARTVVVRTPSIVLARTNVNGNVSIAAVDRAGNVGPAVLVPRHRVR